MLAHNSTAHSKTGVSPYLAFYGRDPPLPKFTDFTPDSLRNKSSKEYIKEFRTRLEHLHEAVRTNTLKKVTKEKGKMEEKRAASKPFKPASLGKCKLLGSLEAAAATSAVSFATISAVTSVQQAFGTHARDTRARLPKEDGPKDKIAKTSDHEVRKLSENKFKGKLKVQFCPKEEVVEDMDVGERVKRRRVAMGQVEAQVYVRREGARSVQGTT